MPQYTCDITVMVTAEDESDAYSQISDAGLSSGALIGTVLIESLDTVERVGD